MWGNEETESQKYVKGLDRWFSGKKSSDYEKYIKPKEEARKKRWAESEKKNKSTW